MNKYSNVRGEEMDENMCCEFMHIHEDVVEKVKSNMPCEEELFDLSELFKAFSDSTRIKILYVLSEAEMCVCDIAQILNMTTSAVSHQLKILKTAKLIKSRKEGKAVFYSLDDDHVSHIIKCGKDHIEE